MLPECNGLRDALAFAIETGVVPKPDASKGRDIQKGKSDSSTSYRFSSAVIKDE